jgi:hypothetical protein
MSTFRYKDAFIQIVVMQLFNLRGKVRSFDLLIQVVA